MHHKLAFYKRAADLLKLAKEDGQNVKNILYNDKKYQFMNVKALYALVSEALKHWEILEVLIKDSKIVVEESRLNVWHVRVLITELLFGKKVLDDNNTFVQTILRYENEFKKLLSKEHIKNLSVSYKSSVEIKVKYVKVNTLKESVDSVINSFVNEGWQQLATAVCYEEYLNQLRELEPGSENFLQDFHIPEVLAFPPKTELHRHDLYRNGSFYFMDKSSCLAPQLLCPHSHSSVLDMCAAPGLKTIHLAALNQSGKIYAVERDHNRFNALKQMVELSGAENVKLVHNDVTKLKLSDFTDVEYILLDPSCSGSGMRERQPQIELDAAPKDNSRLHKLAGFQLTLLRFALTRFPAVRRVVYSTCSLNVEENEEVIQAALNSKFHDFHLIPAAKHLPEWVSFGSDEFEFGSKCIYSRPEIDLTNGFFVAVFERKKYYSNDHSESEVKVENEVKKTKMHKKKSFIEDINDSEGKDVIEKTLDQESAQFLTKKEDSFKNTWNYGNDDHLINEEGLFQDTWDDGSDQISIKKRKRHGKFEENVNKNNHEESLYNNKELNERGSSYISGEKEGNYSNHKRFKLENDHYQLNLPIKNESKTHKIFQKEKFSYWPDGKETNTSHNILATKKVTKSLKKRLRQRKQKMSALHTKKEKIEKRCKEKVNKVTSVKENHDSKIRHLKSSKVSKNTNREDIIKNIPGVSTISKAKLRQIRLKRLKLARNSNVNEPENKIKKLVTHEQHSQSNENKTEIVIKHKKKKHSHSDIGNNDTNPESLQKFENQMLTSEESAVSHKKKHDGKQIVATNKLKEMPSSSSGKKSKDSGNKHTSHQHIELSYNGQNAQDTNTVIITESPNCEAIVSRKSKHKTKLSEGFVTLNTSVVKVGKTKLMSVNLNSLDSGIEEAKLHGNILTDKTSEEMLSGENVGEADEYKTDKKKKKKQSSERLSIAASNGIEYVNTENCANTIQPDNSNDNTTTEIKSHKKKHKRKKRSVSPEVNNIEDGENWDKSNSQLSDFANKEKETVKSPKKKHKKHLRSDHEF